MMNEICKNTFEIWRFWEKNFHVWVLQNNSHLDRLKNIIKNQIFQKKNDSLRLVYELKFAQELIPGLIKSKIDVWKHIVIPWTIVYYHFYKFWDPQILCIFDTQNLWISTFKLCFRFIWWRGVALSIWNFSNMFWSCFSFKTSHYFCVFSFVGVIS